MRTTTPVPTLSLLIFLRLASSLPIPSSTQDYTQACHSSAACAHALSTALYTSTRSTHKPPPSTPRLLTEPHFPAHQLASASRTSSIHVEIRIDNTPVSPTSSTPRTHALSVEQPLSTSYLLSLLDSPSIPSILHSPAALEASSTTDVLSAKPSSALPELRKADAERYWAMTLGSAMEGEESTQEGGCSGAYYRFQRTRVTRTGRDYSDLIVVGIVVLFLAAVVVLEGLEKLRYMWSMKAERNRCLGRRGEIFLEEKEAARTASNPELDELDEKVAGVTEE